MSSKTFSILGKGLSLNDAAAIQPYLDALKALGPDVEEVHFGGNTLGVGASEALAKELKALKKLKVADFADIFTGRLITEIPQALRAISDSLLECPVLEEVSFSDNAFGGRSAEPMVALLSSHPTLAVLKLANNGLGPTGGNIIAQALLDNAKAAKKAGRRSALRVVVCGRNRLENGSANLWGEAFAAHGTLEEVRLYQNGIRREGVSAIARGLRRCRALKVLDLRDNVTAERKDKQGNRRTTGSRAIANSLPFWPDLRSLELTDCLCNIGGGGVLLARGLANGHSKKLETLLLAGNEMTEEAVRELATSIAALPGLVTLDLDDNFGEEDDEAYEAIRQALAAHSHEDALGSLDGLVPFDEDEEEGEEFESDDEAVAEAEEAEDEEPVAQAPSQEDDELANLMNNASLSA